MAAAKKAWLGRTEPGQRPAGTRRAAANARVERMKEVGARYPVSEGSEKTNNNQRDKRQFQKTFCGHGKVLLVHPMKIT